MNTPRDLYNSIKFIEKWQKLLTDIQKKSIENLNDYNIKNKINGIFSIGECYPTVGIPYGNYIDLKQGDNFCKNIIYFGFNFNLYNKSNIRSYPNNTILEKKINSLQDSKESSLNPLSYFFEAKKDEIIENFIFGVAITGSYLNEQNKEFCYNHCIEDIDDNIYIPIESQLLSEKDNIKFIANKIFEICKYYIYTSPKFN